MYLQVDPCGDSAERISIREPDDCTRLHVEAAGGAADEQAVIDLCTEQGVGFPADESSHLRIHVGWLRTNARAAGVGHGWDSRFAAMLDYGRRNGWLDDTTGTVTAHVKRT